MTRRARVQRHNRRRRCRSARELELAAVATPRDQVDRSTEESWRETWGVELQDRGAR